MGATALPPANERTLAARIDDTTVSLFAEGVEIATETHSMSRDADDTLVEIDLGFDGTNYLGAGAAMAAWGLFDGADEDPPLLPLPERSDLLGALDDWHTSDATIPGILLGGLVADTPALGADGLPLLNYEGLAPIGPSGHLTQFASSYAEISGVTLLDSANTISPFVGNGIDLLTKG